MGRAFTEAEDQAILAALKEGPRAWPFHRFALWSRLNRSYSDIEARAVVLLDALQAEAAAGGGTALGHDGTREGS